MRRNVKLAKAELMKLVFMALRILLVFTGLDVDNKFLTKASEGNSSGDLRAMRYNVETEIVFLEVTG